MRLQFLTVSSATMEYHASADDAPSVCTTTIRHVSAVQQKGGRQTARVHLGTQKHTHYACQIESFRSLSVHTGQAFILLCKASTIVNLRAIQICIF